MDVSGPKGPQESKPVLGIKSIDAGKNVTSAPAVTKDSSTEKVSVNKADKFNETIGMLDAANDYVKRGDWRPAVQNAGARFIVPSRVPAG